MNKNPPSLNEDISKEKVSATDITNRADPAEKNHDGKVINEKEENKLPLFYTAPIFKPGKHDFPG
ncbi:MAG TPA: hypothetical protein VI461_18355 [Chitinophagaceae bacterium]|nr:hypothetical protein [Chitinophagaceae bacterium]